MVYAVQGKLGKGENISTGSVMELEAMQRNGEIIKEVPLSDVEIEQIKKSMEREYSQP